MSHRLYSYEITWLINCDLNEFNMVNIRNMISLNSNLFKLALYCRVVHKIIRSNYDMSICHVSNTRHKND